MLRDDKRLLGTVPARGDIAPAGFHGGIVFIAIVIAIAVGAGLLIFYLVQ
jgi:hypothetical protein